MTTNNSKEKKSTEEGGRSLLDTLNSDIELYHKKVQLKRKIERNLAKERQIQEDLMREAEESESANKEKEADKETEDAGKADADGVVTKQTVGEDKEATSSTSKDDEESEKVSRQSVPAKRKRSHSELDGNDEAKDSDESFKENTPKKQKSTRFTHRKRRGNTVPWTKTEDDAIVYYKEEMRYSWKRIEELLKHRHSWQAIQMRYLRNHKSRNEEWSRYMEIKLINYVRKDWENRWKRISEALGNNFSVERCVNKNVEICKKMEMPYFASVFNNKQVTAGYENPYHDIKDAEQHKKLLLVYMGLDSITYDDTDDENEAEDHKES